MVNAVFLDRDGTINELVIGREDPKHVAPWYYAEFEYIEGVPEAIQKLKNLGFTTHVVTNQPDVDDGYMTEQTLDVMNQAMKIELKVDSIQCARQRNTPEYKPNPGMLNKIIKEWVVTPEHSWMIGDSWKDIVAGHKAGVKTIYLGDIYEPPSECMYILPDYYANNLLEAVEIIEKNMEK